MVGRWEAMQGCGLFGVQGLGKSYGLGYFSEACGGVGTCESWWDLLGLWGGYGD